MTPDANDRALISASSLVGYCLSAGDLMPTDRIEPWIQGLLRYARKTAALIDETHDTQQGAKE